MAAERIAVTALKEKLEEGVEIVVVDVRELSELQNGVIAGSVHIPMAQLEKNMAQLPKDVEIVLY